MFSFTKDMYVYHRTYCSRYAYDVYVFDLAKKAKCILMLTLQ